MIKKISQIKEIEGFNKTASALFYENGLADEVKDNFNNLFPDQQALYTFKDYLNVMSPLKNVDKFIEEIKNHSKMDEICVFGDYDVDGIMATTIMCRALAAIGYNIHFSIPDRIRDGYGQQKIEADVEKNKTTLAITVDNGVSAKDFVEKAKELGVKVLVTDHHLPEEGNTPDCLIIDPSYNDDEFKGICGATVALKICYELYKVLAPNKMNIIEELVPLAGVATIADMMPVIGENRIIIKCTLNEINRTKDCNIKNSFQKIIYALGGSNFYNNDQSEATEELIGFEIGPVINAVSRVSGDVTELVDEIIMTIQSPTKWMRSYKKVNDERKKMTTDLLSAYQYDKNYQYTSVFAYNEDNFFYNIKGIIGLIANKVSKSKSVVALIGHRSANSPTIDFSGRSVPGYNLHDGIDRIKNAHPEFEITYGGHASALGVKIKNDENVLKEFKKVLEEDVKNNSGQYEETIYEFEEGYCDEIVNTMYSLQPFGEGFNKLNFIYKGICKSFDNDNKYAEIGAFNFKIYASADSMKPYIGKEVEVLFSLSFDNRQQVEFKGSIKK